MLKWVVLLFMAHGLMAAKRSKEEIAAYKAYLYESQQPSNKTLEERMAENPKAKPWENSGKYQGDIVLLEEDIQELIEKFSTDDDDDLNSRNAVINRDRLWPGAVVPYEIDPRFTQSERNEITRVANLYHERTCVRWVRRTNQRDYVFISAHQDGGCTAQVGFARNHGRHWLNLARPGCLHWTIIFHEMGHSIGFYHMHQTNTRYNYVWINWQNIVERYRFAFYINRYVNMLNLPYEYASNQHYGPHAFSFNGHPTIGARFNDNGLMGQGNFITGIDIWRVARLYNCPGAWSVEVRPEDVNMPYDESFDLRMKQAATNELAKEDDKIQY